MSASALPLRTRSLWDRAVDSLTEEQKAGLDFSQPDKLPLLEGVIQAANQKRELCEQKRWKFTNRKGEVVVIRDVMAKVVYWVKMFVQVGDQIASFDQAHAALPWAAVRFLLQVAVNDTEAAAAIVTAVERISNITTHCTILEELYLSGPRNAAFNELERVSLDLYGTVLAFASRTHAYYGKSTVRRVVGSILGGPSKWADDFQSTTDSLRIELDRRVQVLHAQEQRQLARSQDDKFAQLFVLLERSKEPVAAIQGQLVTITDDLKEEKRNNVLRWVSSIRYRLHQREAARRRIAGSGAWFLNSQNYRDWLSDQSSSWFWLHGLSGCGKTVLASIIIDDLITLFGSSDSPAIYFYCSRTTAEPERESPIEALRSLIRQLAETTDPPRISKTLLEKSKHADLTENSRDRSSLFMEDCVEILVEYSQAFSSVFIVIDALDECDPNEWLDLLTSLEELKTRSVCRMKILVTSREDVDIKEHFTSANVPSSRMTAHENTSDIVQFVKKTLDQVIESKKLLYGRVDDELRQLIETSISTQAEGMFRWAALQISQLCDRRRVRHENDLRLELGRLPKDLEFTYNRMWDDIANLADWSLQLATNVFAWLLCCRRQLPSKQFLSAVGTETMSGSFVPTKDDLMTVCAGLVDWDKGQDLFRFAHPSVREYLLARNPDAEKDAHRIVLLRCLASLGSYQIKNVALDSTTCKVVPNYRHNFGQYAAVAWPLHCHQSRLAAHEDCLPARLAEFLKTSPAHNDFVAWCEFCREHELQLFHEPKGIIDSESIVWENSPLFVIIAFNLTTMIKGRLDSDWTQLGIDRPRRPKEPHALRVAVSYAELATLENAMLESGLTSEATCKYLPLCHAIDADRTDSLRWLLDRGHGSNFDKETSLRRAASLGRIGPLKTLLDYHIDHGIQTALYNAVKYHQVVAAQMLLDYGVEIKLDSKPWTTLLIAAAWGGSLALLKTLVHLNAPWNPAQSHLSFNGTPLISACFSPQAPCSAIEFLISQGADVNEIGGHHVHSLLAVSAMEESSYCLKKAKIRVLMANGAVLRGTEWKNRTDYYGNPHWRLEKYATELTSPDSKIVTRCLVKRKLFGKEDRESEALRTKGVEPEADESDTPDSYATDFEIFLLEMS